MVALFASMADLFAPMAALFAPMAPTCGGGSGRKLFLGGS
jgi:hypothetical protein